MAKPSLSKMIASTRHCQGLSLQDVANAAGVTKTHVWDLEQGKSINPTVKTLKGLADALTLPFERLAIGALNDMERRHD